MPIFLSFRSFMVILFCLLLFAGMFSFGLPSSGGCSDYLCFVIMTHDAVCADDVVLSVMVAKWGG